MAYSPVTALDGAVRVELSEDHPGFADPAYRRRRDDLAALALDYQPGDPIPTPTYTETEHEVWRIVSRELAVKHREYANREFLEAVEALALPRDRIPQLHEVTERLAPLTGWKYLPVAGLAPLCDFYGSFADGTFHSTQYIRHHSVPLYTPEPDIVHEVLGHANQLAHPEFAALCRVVGQVVRRLETPEALLFLSKVFWFTFEFGVAWEGSELRTYGAGVLSSYGELDNFRKAEIRPLDWGAMGTLDYDITHYQPVLFAAPSIPALVEELRGFLEGFDDETALRWTTSTAA
ncbi:MAG TPA: phenylalanine 4-monooxygenase [Acidimicrobiales bacterium]|nr:phenylalanine 4-monooxygenase [Acidimicrobiales bacterium]